MIYRPSDFGPVGTADDTSAVQAAVSAAISDGGGEVELDAAHAINRVTIDGDGVVLHGPSVVTSLDGRAFFANAVANIAGFHASDMTLVGDYSVTGAPAIEMAGAVAPVIERCTISDFGGSGIQSDDNYDLTGATIRDNIITHCGDFGINLNSNATPGRVSNVVVTGNICDGFEGLLYPAHGIYLKGVHGAVVTGNTIRNVTGTGGTSGIIAQVSCLDVTISGNTVEDSFAGILIGTLSDGVIVSGNTIRDCLGGHGVYLYTDCSNVDVIGNIVAGITGSAKAVTLLGVGAQRAADILVSGNAISDAPSGGVYVKLADRVAIVDNAIDCLGPMFRYAIVAEADTTEVSQSGNTVLGLAWPVVIADLPAGWITAAHAGVYESGGALTSAGLSYVGTRRAHTVRPPATGLVGF